MPPILFSTSGAAIATPIGLIRVSVLPATTNIDGFGAGLYYPSDVYYATSDGNPSSHPTGSGFARGLAAQYWSVTGGGVYLGGVNGSQLNWSSGNYDDNSTSTQTLTVTVTDGAGTTYSQPVTRHLAPVAAQLSNNVLFASAAPRSDGHYTVGNLDLHGASGVVCSSPLFTYDAATQQLITTAAAEPPAQHYGRYTFTLTDSASGLNQTHQVWIAAEVAPLAQFKKAAAAIYTTQPSVPATSQDNFSPYSEVGTIVAYSDVGVAAASFTDPSGYLFASTDGQNLVHAVGTVPAPGSYSATFNVVSGSGQSVTVPTPYTVTTATALPASDLTYVVASGLQNNLTTGDSNNVVGPATVVTGSVTGLTSPTFGVDVLNDECQLINFFPASEGFPPFSPRYTISSTGSSFTVQATCASAQTDQVTVWAQDASGNRCTATIPVAYADLRGTGPTLAVTPAGTYPSWNAAANAYWANSSGNLGATITLPVSGIDYTTNGAAGGNGNVDFSRVIPGHGTVQTYLPGPSVLTSAGAASKQRALVDLKGNAPSRNANGIPCAWVDTTFSWLDVRNVVAQGSGEPNAAGIFHLGQTTGNIEIDDCLISGCDQGFSGGGYGVNWSVNRTSVFYCGQGTGGLTHNIYLDEGRLAMTDCNSVCTAQVHSLKARGAATTITATKAGAGIYGDCLNGRGSGVMDFPNGGEVLLSGLTIVVGPNPTGTSSSANGNAVQYAAEITNYGAVGWDHWPHNDLVAENCTILYLVPPGTIVTAGKGFTLYGNPNGNTPYRSYVTGKLATLTVSNCRFYNMPAANWFGSANGGAAPTDGGGNTALTTWPGLVPLDPSTGAAYAPATPISPAFSAYRGNQWTGISLSWNTFQLTAQAGTADIGKALDTAVFYGANGVAATGLTWSIADCFIVTSAGSRGATTPGVVAVNAGTGALTVGAAVSNGLYFFQVACSNGATAWYWLIGGNGGVAGS